MPTNYIAVYTYYFKFPMFKIEFIVDYKNTTMTLFRISLQFTYMNNYCYWRWAKLLTFFFLIILIGYR